MAVKKERVISFVYQKVMRSTLKLIDINLIGPTTKFQLTYQSTNSSAYTMVVGKEKDTFRVMIGGGMVAKVAMLPNSFSSKSLSLSIILLNSSKSLSCNSCCSE